MGASWLVWLRALCRTMDDEYRNSHRRLLYSFLWRISQSVCFELHSTRSCKYVPEPSGNPISVEVPGISRS